MRFRPFSTPKSKSRGEDCQSRITLAIYVVDAGSQQWHLAFLSDNFNLPLSSLHIIRCVIVQHLYLFLLLRIYNCCKIYQVKVSTVLGSAAPPLTVKLVQASSTVAKDSAIIESKVVMIHRLFWVENLFSIIQLFSIPGIFSYFWCLLLWLIQELQYDQKSGFHFLDSFPNNVDVGTYDFVFEVFLSVIQLYIISVASRYIWFNPLF